MEPPLAANGTSIDVTSKTSPPHPGQKCSQTEGDWQTRFFELSTEMMCVIGGDGHIDRANPAWQQTVGYHLSDLKATPLSDFIHEDDRDTLLEELEKLAELKGSQTSGMAASFEARFRGAEGEYRWLAWNAAWFADGLYSTARDITEQKEQEKAVNDAYQKLTFYMVNSPLAFVEWDRQLRISYWSPETERVFGWPADAVLDKTPTDWKFLYEEDTEDFLSVLTGLADDSGERTSSYGRHYRQDGTLVHCEWYHSVLRDENGQVVSLFSLALDVTERKRAEAELLKIRMAVESASDAICIADTTGRIIHLNAAFSQLFRYSLDDMNRCGLESLIDDAEVRKQIAIIVDNGLSWKGEVDMRDHSGTLLPVTLRASAIKDEQGVNIGSITVCTDLSERKQAEQELLHQALHDSLTGLPNRNYFMQHLNRMFLHSRLRENEIACMFIDLDNFKVINDSLGHEAGDDLLKAVATTLIGCVRSQDMVARLGGDEFVILLERIADDMDVCDIAERIAKSLTVPILLGTREVIVTASIGIATSQSTHHQANDLLRDADVAMYQAKTGGKANFVQFDPSMNVEAIARLEMEMDLRHAVVRGELQVYFQPIVHLASNQITEVEALVRWNHPVQGLISPAKFIPIAEEVGLIIPIGDWVLEQSCRYARIWQERFPDAALYTMSVNLSTRQLGQENLVEKVRDVLERTGLDPHRLKLEITESVLMLDSGATIAKLHQLRDMGIRLAIDDFGTGYSSMAYLSSLPVDTLKIDRAFVNRMGQKPEDEAIVRAILTMAKTMGLKVTAEGIETDQQREELDVLGCDRGQGYFFAKPMPAKDLEGLLEKGGSHSDEALALLEELAKRLPRAA